jgi:hypothetical protein
MATNDVAVVEMDVWTTPYRRVNVTDHTRREEYDPIEPIEFCVHGRTLFFAANPRRELPSEIYKTTPPLRTVLPTFQCIDFHELVDGRRCRQY